MKDTVVSEFRVFFDDAVTIEVDYVTSGVLHISLDDETSEKDIAETVTSSLAELLDIHQRYIAVTSVDLESGEVFYEISSPNYDDASEIRFNLEALELSDIENEMKISILSVEVESVDVNVDIKADVNIVVDGSVAGSIGESKRDVTDIFNDQGFDVTCDVAIVTSAPTALPTFATMVPSASPSITGIVVTLTLTKSEDILNANEIASLESELAENYGVDNGDVTIDAEYTVSGSMILDNIPDEISDSELEQILRESIADALGVSSRHVEVSVDSTTGEVSYSVKSDNDITATDLQEELTSLTFADDLTSEIAASLPNVVVASITADDDIHMELQLVVIIDATESTTNIERTNAEIISEFEDQGFSTDSESIIQLLFHLRRFFKQF